MRPPLTPCPHCQSLNPAELTQCLNCDASLTSPHVSPSDESVSLGRVAVRAGVLVAMSMTLSACYGGAPHYQQRHQPPTRPDQSEEQSRATDDAQEAPHASQDASGETSPIQG